MGKNADLIIMDDGEENGLLENEDPKQRCKCSERYSSTPW
jgi:hypothetical protein